MTKLDRSSFSPLSLTWPILIAALLLAVVVFAAWQHSPQGLTPTPTAEAFSPLADPATAEPAIVPESGTPETEPARSEEAGAYPPPNNLNGSGKSKSGPFRNYFPIWYNQKLPFEIQKSGILAVQGFYGCSWAGVAGQVFDLSGTPFQNLVVHLEGMWGGKAFSANALSGSAKDYGPAGYQFILGNKPLDSNGTLWIQLRDATGKDISDLHRLTTYADCARNLILVNFIQVP